MKVTRSGNGYKVEYGKVEDTTPKTVEITKDPIYSFIGLSLETGEQVLQPAKSKWDIMWAYAASSTMMASGPVISFTQDVITINNLGGAETAIVMTDTKSYADFKRADVASAEFQTEANTIGTNWRTPRCRAWRIRVSRQTVSSSSRTVRKTTTSSGSSNSVRATTVSADVRNWSTSC